MCVDVCVCVCVCAVALIGVRAMCMVSVSAWGCLHSCICAAACGGQCVRVGGVFVCGTVSVSECGSSVSVHLLSLVRQRGERLAQVPVDHVLYVASQGKG